MLEIQKFWLDKFDDFLGTQNAKLIVERAYSSSKNEQYVLETKNIYFRLVAFTNYDDMSNLQKSLGVDFLSRSTLKIGDKIYDNFVSYHYNFNDIMRNLLDKFHKKFMSEFLAKSRVWKLSYENYTSFVLIKDDLTSIVFNHKIRLDNHNFQEDFGYIVESLFMNKVIDLSLRDMNFSNIFRKFNGETPYISITPLLLDTTPLDVLGLDLNKASEQNKFKVFVGRENVYYGSFIVNEQERKYFCTCEVSDYILTKNIGFFNERVWGLNKVVSSYIEKTMFVYCDLCGVRHEKTKSENGVCAHCLRDITRYNLNATLLKDYSYSINDHDYKQPLEFLTTQKDNDAKEKLFLGVELEIDSTFAHEDSENPCGCGDDDCDTCNDYENRDTTDHRQNANTILHSISNKAPKQVIGKWDGSLDSGFEIVSQPATLNAHTDLIDWKNGFKTIIDMGYSSHDLGTCGLHVHINRDFFGDLPATQNYNGAKIVYLLEKYWDKFVLFTRRKNSQLERWAKRQNAKWDYDSNNTKTSTMLTNAFQKNYYENRDKYVALNTLHNATFELRIFRGTLNYKTFMATLQFVDNLARLVKKTTLSKLTEITFDDIINFKKYDELSEYWTIRNGGNTTHDGGN